MSLDVALLRASFARILEVCPSPTARFYDLLFERHPEARALFGRNAREQQERMLAGALVAVMDHLDDAPWLDEHLSALGDKHVAYGVTPEMYGWVGAALLAALAEIAGDEWTDQVAAEWSAAYAIIAEKMQRGRAA